VNGLEEAKRMLVKAKADERRALEALERSKRERERAEKMIEQARPVTEELRKQREQNHFTDTFYRHFGGKE
jgi:TRAP-type C4-dicarboxylate transport system substrate-binding protein